MKSLKRWFNKIKLFVFHILEVVIDFMNSNAQVEIEKIKAGKEILMATGSASKEILMATGSASKEILMATGSAVKATVKSLYENKNYMRVTGVIIMGLGVGVIAVGSSLIIADYLH